MTEKAAATVKEIIREGQGSGALPKGKLYLRVRVVAGGCQGYLHKLDLGPDVSPEDHVCVSAGISVVTSKRQADMMRGTTVDYGQENGQLGFKIDNPNFKGESAKRWLAALEKEKGAQ